METERLRIAPLAAADVEGVMYVDGQEAVRVAVDPFGERLPADAAGLRAHAEGLVARGGFHAVRERVGGRFVGVLQFEERDGGQRELGYRLDPACWGLGYAAEAARAMTEAGLAGGAGRVFAHALDSNPASIRVMERAGLVFAAPWSYRGLPGVEYARER